MGVQEVQLHSVLPSALEECEWSALPPATSLRDGGRPNEIWAAHPVGLCTFWRKPWPMPGIEPYFLGRVIRSLVTTSSQLSQSEFSKIISPCVLTCSVALRLLQPQIFRYAPLCVGGEPLHTSRRRILIAAKQLAERSAAQRLCFADCRNWI